MSGYRDLLLKGKKITKESLFKDGDYDDDDDDDDDDGRDLKALKASLFGPQKTKKGSPLASDEEIMGMSESELARELKKPENMRKMMKILSDY